MLDKKVDPANNHLDQELAQSYSPEGGGQVTPFGLDILFNSKVGQHPAVDLPQRTALLLKLLQVCHG